MGLGGIIFIGLIYFFYKPQEETMLKQIEELKARITSSTALPDPTNIASTSDWYYLDHVSSGLTGYDAEKKSFIPLYAESWEVQSDGSHVFNLKKDLKFHDGSPLSAKDILWSIKRHLILKTSTHFPLWDYIEGCENLKTLDQECDGLKITSDNQIVIKLKKQSDSFFLQLASPETGIWSSEDMDAKTASLKPTRFSGPYYVDTITDNYALIKRNSYSPISKRFPQSPKAIKLHRVPMTELNNAVLDKKIDIVIKQYSPYAEPNWAEKAVKADSTTPSSIIYLFGLGKNQRPDIGKDFLKALWQNNQDKVITPADTFLPFASGYSLNKEVFLSELSEKTAKKIRVLCPEGFFSEKFLELLKKSASEVGAIVEFNFGGPKEFFNAFNDPDATKKYDYVLSLYVASERYPAVQLRYMTKSLVAPPIDLKQVETPDLDAKKIAVLKDYQKWLLNSKQAIPLFFDVTLFVYQNNLNIGHQSMSDGEIELWRVQEKAH